MSAATIPATVSGKASGGMAGLIHSEIRKFLSTRLWWLMALLMFGYMAFMAGTMSFAFTFDPDSMRAAGEGAPDMSPREIATSVYTLASALGYIFPLIVGAISVTAEFRHQTITPTLLAEPRRGRLVTAKLLSALPVGFAIGLVGAITSWLVGGAVLSKFGEPFFFDAETLRIVALSILTLTIWAMVGVGFGMVVPNQIGSIIVVIAFTQLVEPILRMAGGMVDWLAPVTLYLPGAAGDALAGGSLYSAMIPTQPLEAWQGGLVLVAYAVVFAIIGRFTTFRKDIG